MPNYTKTNTLIGLTRYKQTNYKTGFSNLPTIFDTNHGFDSFSIEDEIFKFDNAKQMGKRHEFPTWQKNDRIEVKGSFATDLSSWLAAYVPAFALGMNTTEKPVGTTSVYKHNSSLQDFSNPAVGNQLPVTSLILELDSETQLKYQSILIKSFTLSGKTGEQLKISADLIGSGYFETLSIPIAIPTEPVQTSFLRMCDIVFLYGGQSYEAELSDFSFKFDQEVRDKKSYPAGGPKLNATAGAPAIRANLTSKARKADLSFKVTMDKTFPFEDDVLNNTERSIIISAEGDSIESTYKHKIELIFSKLALKSKKIGEEDDQYTYEISSTLYWDSSIKSPFKIIATNNIPNFATLPA